MVTGAVLYPGFESTTVDLHDGGVWVTSAQDDSVGHLNVQSGTLDGGLASPFTDYELHQDQEQVLLLEPASGVLARVDPAGMVLAEQAILPATHGFRLGGGTLSATNPQTGEVFGMRADPVPEVDGVEPLLNVDGPVLATTTVDGVVLAVDVEQQTLHRFAPSGGEDSPAADLVASEPEPLAGVADLDEPQLTAVGGTAVVLDPSRGTLVWPGGSVEDQSLRGARLQAPGPERPEVALTGPRTHLTVSLDRGQIQATDLTDPAQAQSQSGSRTSAAEPVVVGECVHAASAATGTYLRDCPDETDDVLQAVPRLSADAELVFRTNRTAVVLNDVQGGTSWIVTQDMRMVTNWEDLEPPSSEDERDAEESEEITRDTAPPERREENRDPVAVDDEFGVRAGRTVPLQTLLNDSDPDGDVLTVSVTGPQPSVGEVQRTHDGVAFQLVVPDDATGDSSFEYTADDGRGGKDSATVTVRVVPDEINRAPEQLRVPTLTVRAGQSVTGQVVTDWLDPDGDDVRLVDAVAEDPDSVRIRPDGQLTFQDGQGVTGTRTVAITVTDGRETAQGTVQVKVIDGLATPPVTVADHVVAVAGQEAVIRPLANDEDPLGGTLRLAYVGTAPNTQSQFNTEAGTVSFASRTPGTYYLDYVAANEADSTPGLIRVDVMGQDGSEGLPIAVRDIALLPAGGQTLVDVTANDTDPGGGVLVVHGVQVPATADGSRPLVKASVEGYSVVRVVDTGARSAPLTLHYSVANAQGTTRGEITVIPLPEPETLQPPIAVADTAVVRVGDMVSVDVLANDLHPQGAELALEPELAETVPEEHGFATVSDGRVAFLASERPGRTSVAYTVTGPDGQQASARVQFTVVPMDRETNSPPVLPEVTSRVLAGQTVRIPVRLQGTDPDGDWVSLTGLEGTPAQGTVQIDAGQLVYTASEGATGTDSFTYLAEDRLGAQSVGTVSVGIAQPPTSNTPPTAVDDSLTVRPGRTFTVDVLRNDADPDGDPVALVEGGFSSQDPAVQVELRDGRLAVTAPDQPGHLNIRYTIADPLGATDTGTLSVRVDPEAALMPPIARDDHISMDQARGQTAVDVSVLANDEDPDGSVEDLTVSVPSVSGVASTASVTDTGQVQIQLTDAPQIIPYRVTDPDGETATAFITVPGTSSTPPWLLDSTPREVMAGESLALDLTAWVGVREGRQPRLLRDDAVIASPSTASVQIGSATAVTFSAPADYSGSASVNMVITDGSSAEDPTGLTSTLTLPITVLPRPEQNSPPRVRSTAVEVTAGAEPTSVDLSRLAEDPDGDELSFRVEEPGDQIQADLSGALLLVSAGPDTSAGHTEEIGLSVSDGSAEPVPVTVEVTVIRDEVDPPEAVDDLVEDARAGQQVLVDVLANDINPAGDDEPLRLMTTSVVAGQGTATVQGDRVAITPAAGFSGRLRATYEIRDASGDPARSSTAVITVVVAGVPGIPGVPQADGVNDGTAVLSWSAPTDHGSPITHYLLREIGSGRTIECPATSCTVTGLPNGVEHRFTATAVNEIGESQPSAPSAPITPDVRPHAPAAPATDPGDGVVNLTWSAPENPGSPITGYRVQISPAAPGGGTVRTVGPAGGLRWDGLQNGVRYQFRLQAINDADEPSDWGPFSAAVAPAGAPAAPAAPTATHITSVVDGGAVQVDWSMPETHGAAIESYVVTAHQGSAVAESRTVDGATTSLRFTGLDPNGSYSFSVRASNRVGASPSSPRSAVVTPYGRPQAVTGVSTRATGTDRQLTVSYTAVTGSGSRITGYQYALDGGAWQSLGASGQVITVPANGTTYRLQVRAMNSVGPGEPSAAVTTATAYGPIRDASSITSTTGTGSVTFRWNSRTTDYANGRPITSMKVTADGRTVANSGSTTIDSPSGGTHTLAVTVCAQDTPCLTFTGTGIARGEPALTPTPPPTTAPTPPPTTAPPPPTTAPAPPPPTTAPAPPPPTTAPEPTPTPTPTVPAGPRARWDVIDGVRESAFLSIENATPNTTYYIDCFPSSGMYYITDAVTTNDRGMVYALVCEGNPDRMPASSDMLDFGDGVPFGVPGPTYNGQVVYANAGWQ